MFWTSARALLNLSSSSSALLISSSSFWYAWSSFCFFFCRCSIMVTEESKYFLPVVCFNAFSFCISSSNFWNSVCCLPILIFLGCKFAFNNSTSAKKSSTVTGSPLFLVSHEDTPVYLTSELYVALLFLYFAGLLTGYPALLLISGNMKLTSLVFFVFSLSIVTIFFILILWPKSRGGLFNDFFGLRFKLWLIGKVGYLLTEFCLDFICLTGKSILPLIWFIGGLRGGKFSFFMWAWLSGTYV